MAAFPANAQQANAVSAASRMIERATPSQPIALVVAGAGVHHCRRVGLGNAWALDANGYHPDLVKRPGHGWRIPQVTVLLQSTGTDMDIIDVDITSATGRVSGAD
jgi:hypothetical protein